MDKLLERALKQVYGGDAAKVQQQLSTAYAANIGTAVKEGNKKNIFTTFDRPDGEMIRHLQENVYQFSHAKSYQQLKALTQSLYGPDGKIIPFDEFRDIAGRINNEIAVRYLQTEYNTAIGSAQMASQWVRFQADKAVFPLLTYNTAGDGNVRPSHAAIDGVTRPVDDAFWNQYYPPNGWNCRCDVTQGSGRKETPIKDIPIPHDVPPLFKTNTAKKGLAFPEDHPYYDHIPDAVMKAASGSNPYTYEKIYTGKKGGYVYRNPLSNTSAEEIKVSQLLANKGEKIILLPEIPPNTEYQRALKELCQPSGIRPDKSVDCMAVNDGRLMELKNPKASKNAIDRALRDANSKVTNGTKLTVCLKLDEKMTSKQLRDILKDRLPRAKAIDEVWIIDHRNQVRKIKRADLLRTKANKS